MSDLKNVPLCRLCREGAGGECHTPGCALWMNRAPDVPIKYLDADLDAEVSAAGMLAEFHDALGDEPGRGNGSLRITLHEEEHKELVEALKEFHDAEAWFWQTSTADARTHVARELADVVYVAYGTAHALNIDLDVALAEVHRAAMSKLFPREGERVVREDGKLLKPPGFVPPDMSLAVLPALASKRQAT